MKTSKNLITVYFNKTNGLITRVVINNDDVEITMNVKELHCEFIWNVFKYLNKAYTDYLYETLDYVYKEESRSK